MLFGYIARMTRSGMIEALDADYTRTAVLKGLPWPTVIWRHVLRNALMPTITVIATQTGYLIGGLVGGHVDPENLEQMPVLFTYTTMSLVISAIVLALLAIPIARMMRHVDDQEKKIIEETGTASIEAITN